MCEGFLFFLISLSQPDADEVHFHFISFVNVNGQLYELGKVVFVLFIPVCLNIIQSKYVLLFLDGKMDGPVNHGATKDATFITVQFK